MSRNAESISQMINNRVNISDVRIAITNLIESCLEEVKSSLGYWEKECLAQSIASLNWNINSPPQGSYAWLKLCLVNLEKMLVPIDQRSSRCAIRDEHVNALSYEQFVNSIEWLRQRC